MTTWEIRKESRDFAFNFTGSGFLFLRGWENQEPQEIGLHQHEWHEFVWCRTKERAPEKNNEYMIDGERYFFGDRSLLYCPPFHGHAYRLSGCSRTWVMGIDQGQARKMMAHSALALPLDRLFETWKSLPPLMVPEDAAGNAETDPFSMLSRMGFKPGFSDSLEAIHFLVSLNRLLRPWIDGVDGTGPVGPRDSLVVDMMAFLEKNYTRSIGVADCAAHFGVSRSTISHRFAEATGQSLPNWLTGIRLRHARALLAETSLEILDIAMECGFNDSSWFSKIFRQAEGVSPSEWRSRTKNLLESNRSLHKNPSL